MMKRTSAVVLALSLSACAGLGTTQADRYYVLDPGPLGAVPGAPRVRVAPTTAAAFYDTPDIVFSRTVGTRGYYQFNHLTERPQRTVHELLAARLSAGAGARYMLVTHLDEIYHDAVQPPGIARVAMRAELVEVSTRRIAAARTFTASAPAPTFDAAGAVQGFDAAVRIIVADVVVWLAAELDQDRSQPSAAGATPAHDTVESDGTTTIR